MEHYNLMQYPRYILIEQEFSSTWEGLLDDCPQKRTFGLFISLPVSEDSISYSESSEQALSLSDITQAFSNLPIGLERLGIHRILSYTPTTADLYPYLEEMLDTRGVEGVYYHPCTSPWVARWIRRWHPGKAVISGYGDDSPLLSITDLYAEGIRHFILHDRRLIQDIIKSLPLQCEQIRPVFNMEVLLRLGRQTPNQKVDWLVIEEVMDALMMGWPMVR
jgi:hypothetical protein